MKGPESRKFLKKIIKISVTVKIHPLCTSDQRENFKWGPWGAVYVTSQGDSTLNILRESYCLVSHAPDSFGKESGNFSRVSMCRKNAI